MSRSTDIKAPSAAAQDFPPHGFCVFSEQREIPYRWCGQPTGDIAKPWCPDHAAIVYQPILPKGPEQ